MELITALKKSRLSFITVFGFFFGGGLMCRPSRWIRKFILFFLIRELDVPGSKY